MSDLVWSRRAKVAEALRHCTPRWRANLKLTSQFPTICSKGGGKRRGAHIKLKRRYRREGCDRLQFLWRRKIVNLDVARTAGRNVVHNRTFCTEAGQKAAGFPDLRGRPESVQLGHGQIQHEPDAKSVLSRTYECTFSYGVYPIDCNTQIRSLAIAFPRRHPPSARFDPGQPPA